jgi:hemolysin activation/secretion protein
MRDNGMTFISRTALVALAVWGCAVLSASSVPAAADDAVQRFVIKRFVLEGNSILTTQQTTELLAPHTGPQRDFGHIQKAIEALESAYRTRGYSMVTVTLPEQELTQGDVRLRVIEPQIKEIKIEGNSYRTRDNITASLPSLKIGASPQVDVISENLRVVNENPAKKVTLEFKAQSRPEDLEALLQVKDEKAWKVALSGDNTGNKQSGYYRMGLMLQHANLWNRDHVAVLQYSTSPDHADKVAIISGSYRVPLYSLGDTIDLFGGYSDVDNGNSQISGTDLSISGKGIVTGLRYNWSLPRAGAYEHKLALGVDYRLYDNTVTVSGAAGDISPDVVAHPFNITYGASWSNELLSADGSLGVLHNQPWGGQGQQEDFQRIRSGAAADYWVFRYGINNTIRAGGDWLVRVSANGQYTPDRLISGEQFGLGGANSIRGYVEREESFDAGFSGSVELYSPDLATLLQVPKVQLRLLGFFDGGYGYNLRPQLESSEQRDHSLTSVGTGARLGVGDFFSFSMDWGYALNNSTSTTDPTKRGDSRIHFKASVSY